MIAYLVVNTIVYFAFTYGIMKDTPFAEYKSDPTAFFVINALIIMTIFSLVLLVLQFIKIPIIITIG